MQLLFGALVALLIETLVIALLFAPRWTLRMLTRPIRAAVARVRIAPKRAHMPHASGR